MSDEILLAIEIGGTKLQLCAGRRDGTIVEQRQFNVTVDAGAAGIRTQLANELPRLQREFQPVACGVGFGGPVASSTGKIACSHQIAGWSEFPLGQWLSEMLHVPVFVDNDTNVAALGEALCGAGRGQSPVFYTNFGSGVGGGLVIDERIYHGAPPGEVEFGHVRLDRTGVTVEDRCSGWSVDRQIQQAVAANPRGPLAKLLADNPGPAAQCLPLALAAGDPVAQQIFANVTTDIAFALSHVVHLFHPAVIVLGGGLSQWGEPFVTAVAAQLPKFLMESFCPGPSVLLAKLRSAVVPVGALLLAGQRLAE